MPLRAWSSMLRSPSISSSWCWRICRDLSANGMGIAVSEHQLDINQPIRISLATNNNLLPPFEAHARIIRVLEEEIGLLLAVEFLPQG